MSDGRASRADDRRPDLKWVVEWLVAAGGTAQDGGPPGREPEDGGPGPEP